MLYLTIYLAIVNALGLALMLADKEKARRKAWRIPERTLMAVAVLGGSLGALVGMQLFRHKTKQPKFMIGIPALFVAQIVILIIIFV